ncbi:hypothetical protein AWH48_11940 [Domibacillus aminovorans]|uniref:NodB homology domain-containing protein n=1 Tax=Domibacillus aminovorans TaxID=29332 RepID=A0A177KI38_9BACI|nr:polysaccharide deacetylase family protein [Domibacillus aminovorans]OAH53063.1 hypothetical protein AWH48_11940 [Domibacillus aminovorans]
MVKRIKIKRGLKANLPLLNEGEPALTTDKQTLFIGANIGNVEFINKSDIEDKISTASGLLNTEINTTKADLQAAKTDLSNTKTDLANTKSDLQTTKTSLNNAKTDLQSAKTDIENMDQLLTETSSIVNDLTILVDDLIENGIPKTIYSPFITTQENTITLGPDAKIGKLNVGIRGNMDEVEKKLTKNITITSESADDANTSQMTLNWSSGEGRSTKGVFDSIVGGGYQDLTSFNMAPRAILTFDDGWSSVYALAYPYMKSKGIKGTCYIVPPFLETAGYMTLLQLQTMFFSAGWCMGNHTTTHPNMGSYSYVDALNEIGVCNNWLRANGFADGLRHIAFPNGAYNDDVLQACRDLGLKTARKTGNQLNNNFSLADDLRLIAPITCGLGGGSPNFAAVKTQIDNAIAQGKVCIMMFHRIVNTAGENGSSTTDGMNFVYSDFVQVIDYLVSTGIITETIDEFYNSLTNAIKEYKENSQSIEFDSNYQEIQRTGKKILDGSLNWTSPVLFQTNCYRASVSGWSAANPEVSTLVGSNHTDYNDLFSFQTVDAINGTLPNRYQVAVHTSGVLYISFDKDYAITNGLTTAAALKTWLNNHPITMVYERSTPIVNNVSVTITTNGQSDTSLRSFGEGTVITVSHAIDSAKPTIIENHPV